MKEKDGRPKAGPLLHMRCSRSIASEGLNGLSAPARRLLRRTEETPLFLITPPPCGLTGHPFPSNPSAKSCRALSGHLSFDRPLFRHWSAFNN